MKYLVNARTKEHCIYEGGPYGADWRIVEADEEGWIPWNGGECPLPDGMEFDYKMRGGACGTALKSDKWGVRWCHKGCGGDVIAYRPSLAEKEEAQPKSILGPDFDFTSTGKMPYSAHSPSVFDRLKSAIAAAESIPAIIAEIDAMLPEGYFVSKTLTDIQETIVAPLEPAEDMSDWGNWREGDLVTAHGLRGGYTKYALPENVPHTIVAKCLSGFNVQSSNGDVLHFNGRELARGELKFHSRPAKVTE